MLCITKCIRCLTNDTVFHVETKIPTTNNPIEYLYTENAWVKQNGLTGGIVVIGKEDFDHIMEFVNGGSNN